MTELVMPDSSVLLAPMRLSTPRLSERPERLELLLATATWSVPAVRSSWTLRRGRSKTVVERQRAMLMGASTDPLRQIARLCDREPDNADDQAWTRWYWEVAAVLDPTQTTVTWEVTRFRVGAEGLVEAHRLALLRHLFVDGLRAVDPDSAVVEGADAWDPAWWPAA